MNLPFRKKVTDAIRDVFDANTAADQQRRISAGQAADYRTQQQSMGNKGYTNPVTSIAYNFAKPVAQAINTGTVMAGKAMATPYVAGDLIKESIVGTDQSYQDKLNKVGNWYSKAGLGTSGGLLGVGTTLQDTHELNNPSRMAGSILETGTNIGSVIPVGGAAVSTGRVAVGLAGMNAGINAASDIGTQLRTNGTIDNPGSVVTSAAIGAALPIVSHGAGNVVKYARTGAQRADHSIVNAQLPENRRMSFDDRMTLSDYADYVAGRYKPADSAAHNKLISDAWNISDRLGLNVRNNSRQGVQDEIANYLDAFDSVRSSVRQRGAVGGSPDQTAAKLEAKLASKKPQPQTTQTDNTPAYMRKRPTTIEEQQTQAKLGVTNKPGKKQMSDAETKYRAELKQKRAVGDPRGQLDEKGIPYDGPTDIPAYQRRATDKAIASIDEEIAALDKSIKAVPDKSPEAAKFDAKKNFAKDGDKRKYEARMKAQGEMKDARARLQARRDQLAQERDVTLKAKEVEQARLTPKAIEIKQSRSRGQKVKVADKPKVTMKQPVEAPVEPDINPVDPKSPNVFTKLNKTQVEGDAVINQTLRNIEKQTGQEGLVDTHYRLSNEQRGADRTANVELQHSENVNKAVGGLSRRQNKKFSEYSNARTELAWARKQVGKDGKPLKVKTSRPPEELAKIVADGDAQFGERFTAMNAHYKTLAKDAYDAGLISKERYDAYTSNDDYARIQRDMSDLVDTQYGKGGNSYSLTNSGMNQKRKGSSRQTIDATSAMIDFTQQVKTRIAKNKTATNLVDTLVQAGQAKKVSASQAVNKNTVSVFRKGKQEHYEVTKDIKIAMDNISPYHLGIIEQIVSIPGRVVRAGITGLNPVFIARNLVKDQVGSFINSEHKLATHNPLAIWNGLAGAASDVVGLNNDPLYVEFLKKYGNVTSYDLNRNIKGNKAFAARLRGGKKTGAVQAVTHPLRTLENVAATTEVATRWQNFRGSYQKLVDQGMSHEQAIEQASMAAWKNSVDFSRAGTWGRTINTVIPYWNPGVQGTRQMLSTMKNHPVQSSVAGLATVGLPIMAATAWNLSDPQTKEVYDNIPEYEKDNNIILIPPGTTQNPDGKGYDGIIKIPLPPGWKDLYMPLRYAMEMHAHDKNVEGKANDAYSMAQSILQAVSGPVQTGSVDQFGASFMPQAAKPAIQQLMNKDMFTGSAIVPDYMQTATDASGNPVAESKKAYDSSSPTAKAIGDKTNTSPIRVEKFIKDTTGTVGVNVLNAVDAATADGSVKDRAVNVTKELAGGAGWKKSFGAATGIVDKTPSEGTQHFSDLESATKGLTQAEKDAYGALHPSSKNFLGDTIYEADSTYNPAARLDIYNRFPKVFEADKKMNAASVSRGNPSNPLFELSSEQVKKVLEKDNLPPGAKDPELSNLYKLPWYQDYQVSKSQYYDQVRANIESKYNTAKQSGDAQALKSAEAAYTKFNSSDNPYPQASPELQKTMDTYMALPSGTGDRSAWIRSHPSEWAAMQKQFAAIDNWQNNARGKRGLARTEGEEGKKNGYGTDYNSYGYGGGGNGGFSTSKYYGSASRSGGASKPEVSIKQVTKLKAAKKTAQKPSAKIVKSKV